MFKDIISAPRMFKDPRITSKGKYRYRLLLTYQGKLSLFYFISHYLANNFIHKNKNRYRIREPLDLLTNISAGFVRDIYTDIHKTDTLLETYIQTYTRQT